MYKQKLEIYHIPIRFYAEYNFVLVASAIFLSLSVIAPNFLIFSHPNVNIHEKIAISTMMLPLYLYALYIDADLINSFVLKKQYVEINFDGIIIKKLFKDLVIRWDDIFGAETYSFRNFESIRLTRMKDAAVDPFPSIFGGAFAKIHVDIPSRKYRNIDSRKFINTIGKHLK